MRQAELEAINKAVEQLFAGEVNKATARLNAMLALRAAGAWELAQRDDWLDELIDTNFGLRCGWRDYEWQRSASVILDVWPAQELIFVWPEKERKDWVNVWLAHGGGVFDGRKMIALKDDPIWSAISEFGLPFPPFAKGSTSRVREINRTRSMALGLIDRNRQIKLRKVRWNRELITWMPEPITEADEWDG